MSLPDATAIAALGGDIIKPVYFGYLDIIGDPLRANSSGADITPSGTGDADLDGDLFVGISHVFIDVSPVRVTSGGSQSVTARLSGLPSIDGGMLTTLSVKSNWQGRVARLWRVIRDADNVQQGGYQPYYTGYMTALDLSGNSDGQVISVTIESYLAAFSGPSNRTYLDQERYDAGDLSARAAIAIANGISSNPLTGATPGPSPRAREGGPGFRMGREL